MSSSFIFGCLLALYFYIGRWTFARIEGDYASVPAVEQPRFWLVAALIAVCLIIQCSKPRAFQKFRLYQIDAAILAFLSYMILTAFWGSSAEMSAEKAFELSLIWTVALVISISRPRWLDDQVQLGFWSSMVAVGVAMGLLALWHGDDLRAYAPGGGPNTFSRNMGLMALGAMYLASRFGLAARIGGGLLVASAAMLIMRSGSRGGLLAFSVALGLYAVTAKSSLVKKSFVVGLMAAATAFALLYTDVGGQALEVFRGRIVEQTVENQYLAGRDDLWLQAIEMAIERPLAGWGLDGFRANSWNYPHNLFLEVTVEGGLVGLLFLLNIGRAWWAHSRRSRRPVSRAPFVALALTLTAAQTSGDLFDSRGVFLMIALSAPAFIARRSSVAHRSRAAARPARSAPVQISNPVRLKPAALQTLQHGQEAQLRLSNPIAYTKVRTPNR
jgi:O-antigen ligase